MVVCLELGADLHMIQMMPLPLTVSCFSKIQIGFSFLVPADPGSPSSHTKTSSIHSAVSIELGLVTDTDGYRRTQGHDTAQSGV